MPASLQKFSDNRKIDPNHERAIHCPYCPQKYLLVWDDEEVESSARPQTQNRGAPCCGVCGNFLSKLITLSKS